MHYSYQNGLFYIQSMSYTSPGNRTNTFLQCRIMQRSKFLAQTANYSQIRADSDYFLLDPLLIINLGGLYLDLIENLQSHIIVEVRRAEQ
jgi:hypothetical protein